MSDLSRLDRERQRLFPAQRLCPPGQVRTLRLVVRQPAGWSALAGLWQGVQAELELPAPAIEIDGANGHALWFSLAEPATQDEAERFLKRLKARWLPELPDAQVQLQAGTPPDLPPSLRHPDQWSAFVARDLAPVFGDTPWLDTPPNPEGQADLLSGLRSIGRDAWQQALGALNPRMADPSDAQAPNAPPTERTAGAALPLTALEAQGPFTDPRQFLMAVMNDAQTPLPLRIDAAKALLK